MGRLGILVGLLFAIVVGTGAAPSGTSAVSESIPPGSIVYSAGELPLVPVRRQLVVARPDGSEATTVTTGSDDFSAQWAPDGRRIVFTRSVGVDRTEIWLVNADGTGARPLDQDHPYAEHPRWSPDARWIAYQVRRRRTSTPERARIRPSSSGWFVPTVQDAFGSSRATYCSRTTTRNTRSRAERGAGLRIVAGSLTCATGSESSTLRRAGPATAVEARTWRGRPTAAGWRRRSARRTSHRPAGLWQRVDRPAHDREAHAPHA